MNVEEAFVFKVGDTIWCKTGSKSYKLYVTLVSGTGLNLNATIIDGDKTKIANGDLLVLSPSIIVAITLWLRCSFLLIRLIAQIFFAVLV